MGSGTESWGNIYAKLLWWEEAQISGHLKEARMKENKEEGESEVWRWAGTRLCWALSHRFGKTGFACASWSEFPVRL